MHSLLVPQTDTLSSRSEEWRTPTTYVTYASAFATPDELARLSTGDANYFQSVTVVTEMSRCKTCMKETDTIVAVIAHGGFASVGSPTNGGYS